jgi:hypothetical protein
MAAEAPPGRLPDFFIAGQPKSGTTALYEMLRNHPQIYMSAVKEPHYFAVDKPLPERTDGRRWSSLDQTGVRELGLDDYLELFAPAAADQLAGEATTSYLWSPSAARRIAELQPSARIIGIFREPAAFLRALHLQLVRNRHETELDLRTALSLDDARREGRHIPDRSVWPSALIYSDRVRYVEQLRRYEQLFPPEQVLTLIYDDFRADNEATLRRVFSFLGVEADVAVDPLDVHEAVRVRQSGMALVRRLSNPRGPAGRALKGTVRAVLPAGTRVGMRRRVAFTKPEPVDEGLVRELRGRFKGEVVALGEHLGRDLASLWGYDDAS